MNGRQRKGGWLGGDLFVVLFVAGVVLSGVASSPSLNGSAAKITRYYQGHHAGILVSELLINLAAQRRPADPSLTQARYELNNGVHLAFFPLVGLTATLAAVIFQGAIGARWVGSKAGRQRPRTSAGRLRSRQLMRGSVQCTAVFPMTRRRMPDRGGA